jgi:hypothetical protein
MAALNSGPPDPERYARAAIELMEAARLKPIDYRFPLLLARLEDRVAPALFTDRGAPDRATALYARAARLAPLDPRPSLELAGHLVARGRLEEGLEATARSVAVEPNFLRARILQASILARLGREEEARRAREALDATLRALAGYEPDSSYARDLVQDAPEERRRLMAAAAPSPDPPENRATR